ncbi:NADP-dependent oxidoreductase [Streptomyces sp. LUP30]|uniref:NADP-dependent oxidoreductase n=1 Tax=Streptomyces sp. LUP30 TaxID=1890285 RepID=UPI0009A06F0B|nr:NADP-dependent oxidoreductase [Streptomyces sp. LUP30]
MKAVIAQSYVPVDQLVVTDAAPPTPGPGQVLVRVEAAGLNPIDAILITGRLRQVMPVEHPFVPGMDAAGVVEAVGAGVTRFAPGDKVVAFTHDTTGTLAELTIVADGPGLVHRPESVDAVTGAALPVSGMTAAALLEASGLTAGRSVLIVGATGGIGSYLVQLASGAGAEVIATAQPSALDHVRKLGAAHAVDYTSVDPVAEARRLYPDGVDVVIDLVNGGPAVESTAAAVRPGGRLVSSIGVPDSLDRDVTPVHVGVENGIGRLEELVGKVASGELTVHVSGTYPLADAAQAYADFTGGKHPVGKVVITV